MVKMPFQIFHTLIASNIFDEENRNKDAVSVLQPVFHCFLFHKLYYSL